MGIRKLKSSMQHFQEYRVQTFGQDAWRAMPAEQQASIPKQIQIKSRNASIKKWEEGPKEVV
ncbi:hypothetical protein ABZP36_021012 [Zizania latifolia]